MREPGCTMTTLPSVSSMTTCPPPRVSISSPGASRSPRLRGCEGVTVLDRIVLPETLATRASTVGVWALTPEAAAWTNNPKSRVLMSALHSALLGKTLERKKEGLNRPPEVPGEGTQRSRRPHRFQLLVPHLRAE